VDALPAFAWHATDAACSFVVRVLDADFGEVFRLEPVPPGVTVAPLPTDLQARLRPGVLHHWLVEGTLAGVAVRSRVAPFWLRAR
jgi:hypothetical protein